MLPADSIIYEDKQPGEPGSFDGDATINLDDNQVVSLNVLDSENKYQGRILLGFSTRSHVLRNYQADHNSVFVNPFHEYKVSKSLNGGVDVENMGFFGEGNPLILFDLLPGGGNSSSTSTDLTRGKFSVKDNPKRKQHTKLCKMY